MESTSPVAPIACSLSQQGQAERGRRWRSLADDALIGVVSTRDGLRLSFDARPGAEEELRHLAGLETECCAFASWTVRSIDKTVVLDVTGTSPEAAAVVREMFTELRDLAATARGDGDCPG